MQQEQMVVSRWHDAVNRSDLELLAEQLQPDVAIVGPRGSAHGVDMVLAWASRAGITLQPTAWYAAGDEMVVGQEARWRDAASGQLGEPFQIGTRFRLRAGLIAHIERHMELSEALAAAGLDAAAEVAAP